MMDWALENDMLTLAFVTTYAHLIDGGIDSGVSRSALPPELRPVHDNIIELRNKRYAHNAGHDLITGSLEIGFEGGKPCAGCNGDTMRSVLVITLIFILIYLRFPRFGSRS
jgi:hypothetical protein